MCQRLPGASSRKEVETVRPRWPLVARVEFCAAAAAARNNRVAQALMKTGRMGESSRKEKSCDDLARSVGVLLRNPTANPPVDSLVPRSHCRAMGVRGATASEGARQASCRHRTVIPACGTRPWRLYTPRRRSVAQPGRAPRSGRGGRRFKSCHSDQHLAVIHDPCATPCATPWGRSRECGKTAAEQARNST